MRSDSVKRFFVAVSLALLATACTTRGGSIPYDVQGFKAPDAPASIATENAYKLAPLDVVAVTVFQVPDLSHDYTIDYTGRFTMPLVGSVNAIGLSANELATRIQTRLAERYLRDPSVVVALKESGGRVITVDGSVKEPGVFPAVGPLTLMQAVALARGADSGANPRRVAVFRVVDGKRMAAAFDLVDIRRGKMEDPAVYAGDTIVVDGSRLKDAQAKLFATIPLLPIFMALGN